MDLVSVVLPFRDAANTLKRAIDSILDQDYRNFELIVINDGSTDESAELLDKYNDDRIKRIDLAPSGIVTALNEGLYASQGKYIARMDADDWSHPSRLGKQVRFLEKHPDIGIAATKVQYKGNIDENFGYYHYVEWTNSLLSHEEIFINRFVESPVSHPSVMIRHEILKKYGNYAEGEFPEDYELWLRLMAKGVKIGKVNEFLLDWYDDQNRLSRRHRKYSSDAFYEIKSKYFAKWLTSFFKSPPPILIWGTGKAVIQKSNWLEETGIEIDGYIDVVDKKDYWVRNKPVFYYEDLPRKVLILSYVSDREGRIQIHDYLIKNGYREGYDFLMMA